MSNWNEVLSSTRNLNDVLIVLQKVLALLQNKADVTTIDEALDSLATLDQQAADSIREMTNRLNQFSDDADAATNEAIMRATVRGFATEQILKQWTPTLMVPAPKQTIQKAFIVMMKACRLMKDG